MSTLKVIGLQHPSSVSNNVVLSGNGYVTMPLQPAFLASFSTSGTITYGTGGTKIAFNALKFDRTGAFSTTNNRFTAQVAGIYKFTASFHINATSGNSRIVYRVNGSDYNLTVDAAQSIENITGTEMSLVVDCLIQLNLNDYVELFTRSGSGSTSFYSGHSWWSGYLIG